MFIWEQRYQVYTVIVTKKNHLRYKTMLFALQIVRLAVGLKVVVLIHAECRLLNSAHVKGVTVLRFLSVQCGMMKIVVLYWCRD